MSSTKLPKGQKPTGDPELGARIRELREKAGLSLKAFGEKIGVSDAAVIRYEKGERYPQHKALARIAEFGNVSIQWLTMGDAETTMYELVEDLSDRSKEIAEYYRTRKPIPVVGTASANPNATIEWEEIEHEVTEFGPVIAIRVEDDSMEPLARQGQFVLAIPDADLHDGDLAVLRIRRKGVLFKRIYYNKTANTFELQSANPVKPQPSMTVKPGDITKQYRVIGVKFE